MRRAYRKLYEYELAAPPSPDHLFHSSLIIYSSHPSLSVIAFFQFIFSHHSIIPPGISVFVISRIRYSRDEDDTEGGGPEGVSDI